MIERFRLLEGGAAPAASFFLGAQKEAKEAPRGERNRRAGEDTRPYGVSGNTSVFA